MIFRKNLFFGKILKETVSYRLSPLISRRAQLHNRKVFFYENQRKISNNFRLIHSIPFIGYAVTKQLVRRIASGRGASACAPDKY